MASSGTSVANGGALGVSCVLIALLLQVAGSALAQPALDEARTALEDARFADADRLFTQAADAQSGLSRQSLIDLLHGRALARGALRDTPGARADLLALLALDPGASLGTEASPSLQAVFQEARASAPGPLAVEVEASAVEGGFEVRTRVSNDPSGLVREVRVYDLDAPAVAQRGEVVRIERDGSLRYVVEVVGWGGAVLASEGTPDAPRLAGRGAGSSGGGSGAGEGGDSTGLYIGLGIGGAVLLAAVIVIAVLLSPSGRTQVGIPMEILP